MRITVEDTTPTRQERWTFWISFPQALLDDYTLGTKTTRQRNYRLEKEWHRTDGRRDTIKLEEIPQPAYVAVEVLAEMKRIISIGVPRENARSWSDMKRWHSHTPRPCGNVTVR